MSDEDRALLCNILARMKNVLDVTAREVFSRSVMDAPKYGQIRKDLEFVEISIDYLSLTVIE